MRVPGLLEALALREGMDGVTGTEFAKRVAAYTGGRYTPSFGSVYPLFSRLEKQGLLLAALSGSGRRQIRYRTTPKGKRQLASLRRTLKTESDARFKVVLPVIMRVVHGFDDAEMRAFAETFSKMVALHDRMLRLPPEKRSQAMQRMLHSCARLSR